MTGLRERLAELAGEWTEMSAALRGRTGDKGAIYGACGATLRHELAEDKTPAAADDVEALADRLAAARAEGRAEQLTDDDKRNLAAIYGYELGREEGRAEGAAAALGPIEARLRAAFSGDDFEENARAAAAEDEWAWFRWLALEALTPGRDAAKGGAS